MKNKALIFVAAAAVVVSFFAGYAVGKISDDNTESYTTNASYTEEKTSNNDTDIHNITSSDTLIEENTSLQDISSEQDVSDTIAITEENTVDHAEARDNGTRESNDTDIIPVVAVQPDETLSEKTPLQSTASASSCDYVLNTSSKKIHYPTCSSVKSMKEHNTAYFNGTRDEAIAAGYQPCGRCNP